MAKKKTDRQRAIARLDKAWSICIRYGAANERGVVECYTCGKEDTPQRMHCGHFASRRFIATRWDADNCRPQCVRCNIYDSGRQYEFARRLNEEEPGLADEVYRRAHRTTKIATHEILERARETDRRAQILQREMG